jgi:1,4-alpha-glucan branching enzyme
VRRYIRDNALMWLGDYRVDGLRWDATLYIRTAHGREADPADHLADGWDLMRWVNDEARSAFPGRLTIAEDLQNNESLTRPTRDGGAGFDAQWDPGFVHAIRAAVTSADDPSRGMGAVRDAVLHAYNGQAFQRVIYSESHDDVANGKARVPREIVPGDPDNWFAQKRSTLAAALVLTAPGIPMLFQGQEFLEGTWFRDDVPLDWDQSETFAGIVRLYRDLVRLRLNRLGTSRGLCGPGAKVHHVNEDRKVIALHRWDRGGPRDDVLVVANFANQSYDGYTVGVPREGAWRVRFNSDWNGYSRDFGNRASGDVVAEKTARDGYPFQGSVGVAAYSVIVLSQDE